MSDKLPHQLGLNGLPYFNKDLFANHFLRNRIKAAEFRNRQPDELQGVLEELCALYEHWRPRIEANPNEAATEEDFIHKVLALLWNDADGGSAMDVQPPLAVGQRTVKPDVALFPDAATRSRVVARTRPGYWENHAVALVESKRWGANLDKLEVEGAALFAGRRRQESPAAQLTEYLLRSDIRWGILTNGRLWRLYERDSSRRASPYFEVNLEALLQYPDVERFWWFYNFFSRAGLSDSILGRAPFVERVFAGSLKYARDLGESIKENVTDALELLIQGFFAYQQNQLDPASHADRIRAKEAGLIVLYRLLFVAFAEARPGLLPVANPAYQHDSLESLQSEVHDLLRSGRPLSLGSLKYWGNLREMWRRIDQGEELGGEPPRIPAYDGGLFEPRRWPEIAWDQPRWQIGNSRLAEVIDLLAFPRRRWDEQSQERADYSALGVRELGSIYESLLEQHPVQADAALAARLARPSGSRKAPAPSRRPVEPGQVCLINDKGERKATGSYYTPDYIVEYIVDETLGPLLDERIARLEAGLDGLTRRLAELEKQYQGKPPQQQAQGRRERELAAQDFLAPVASGLKVLDPAMGSGHFLVAAADAIARRLAAVRDLITIFELAGLLPESEAPLDYFRRFAVEHCLYGVDLNPLAVELAKLSLWLHTVSGDRALSFLDHRLRCGNSLIGARVDENLRYAPRPVSKAGQRKWDETMSRPVAERRQLLHGVFAENDIPRFLASLQEIERITGGTADDQHEKRDIYRELDKGRERYRRLADAWFAPFYEIDVPEAEYSAAFAAVGDDAKWRAIEAYPWYGGARSRFEQQRVFHWELEFPDVFFEQRQTEPGATPLARRRPEETRGFDAVIGNPPYVRQEGLGEDKLLFSFLWHEVYDGIADLYVYFYAAGLRLLNLRGRFGMITSNKFFRANYGRELRRHLRRAARLESVVDFGELRVFGKEASPDACIVIMGKQPVSALDFNAQPQRAAPTAAEAGTTPRAVGAGAPACAPEDEDAQAQGLAPTIPVGQAPVPAWKGIAPAQVEDFHIYRRKLPHWRQTGSMYFVTWRLAQGLPPLSERERELVAQALRHFDGERYFLYSYVVMDDHVHVLVQPQAGHSLESVYHGWKSITAHKLQREHGRRGKVWQTESFDRIVRDQDELHEKAYYILTNPQRRWGADTEYRWTYLNQQFPEFADAQPQGAAPTGAASIVHFTQMKSIRELESGEKKLREIVSELRGALGPEAFAGVSWSLGSADEVTLLRKLEAQGQPLRQYLADRGITFRRGVLTGFNAAFVIDRGRRDELIAADPRSAELIKPLLAGDDVRRYYADFR